MTTDNPQGGLSRADRIAARFKATDDAAAVAAPTSSTTEVSPGERSASTNADPEPPAKTPRSARVQVEARPTPPQRRPKDAVRWEDNNTKYQVWLPNDFVARLKAAAAAQGITASKMVIEALEDWIVKHNLG